MPCEVAAAEGLAFFGEGKFEDWSAFVEVVVDWANEMANSWRSGHIAAQGGLSGHGGIAHGWWCDVQAVNVEGGIWGSGGGSLEDGGIVTGDEEVDKSGTGWPQLADGYSWLKHGGLRGRLCFKLRRRDSKCSRSPIDDFRHDRNGGTDGLWSFCTGKGVADMMVLAAHQSRRQILEAWNFRWRKASTNRRSASFLCN